MSQDRGETWLQRHFLAAPIGLLPVSFCDTFLPCCVFDFVFNFVRLAVNGAWLVLGINDMTRDTLLLEFSQVRATPIEDSWVPLCLPSRGRKASCSLSLTLFLSLFLLFFQLIKEREMDTKDLIRGDMKMGKGGEWNSRSETEKSSGARERSVCVNEGAECEQPALAARYPALALSRLFGTWMCLPWPGLHPSLPLTSSFGQSVIESADRGFARGCRRWGAAPQWISGWHGDVSVVVVGALPRAPACLF